MYVTKYY